MNEKRFCMDCKKKEVVVFNAGNFACMNCGLTSEYLEVLDARVAKMLSRA
jgi:ribosomal protein L37AE/L43A